METLQSPIFPHTKGHLRPSILITSNHMMPTFKSIFCICSKVFSVIFQKYFKYLYFGSNETFTVDFRSVLTSHFYLLYFCISSKVLFCICSKVLSVFAQKYFLYLFGLWGSGYLGFPGVPPWQPGQLEAEANLIIHFQSASKTRNMQISFQNQNELGEYHIIHFQLKLC